MKKVNKINKAKAVYDILAAASEDNILEVTQDKAMQICRNYFPDCDEVMLNTFRSFAFYAQNYLGYLEFVGQAVNRYDREQREPK